MIFPDLGAGELVRGVAPGLAETNPSIIPRPSSAREHEYVNISTGAWTGELVLELRSGNDWSIGDAEVSVRRDTVVLRHEGRCLAVLDRDQLRNWLTRAEPEPLAVDDAIWSVDTGTTFIAVMAGSAPRFRVTSESLSNLVMVL